MRKSDTDTAALERMLAIGLVWGHVVAGQFEAAHRLARGCLRLWPQDPALALMAAHAAAELLEPVDRTLLETLRGQQSCTEWVALLARRLSLQDAAGTGGTGATVQELP